MPCPDPAQLDVALAADDAWLCAHVDHAGAPAPSTRLALRETTDWLPGAWTSAPRRRLCCPDCGVVWCIWQRERVARPYLQWPADGRAPAATRYRHAPVRDIDRVIARVFERCDRVRVDQHWQTWPGDNDGLWFFEAPGVDGWVQIESDNGMCPFLVEPTDAVRLWAATVEEAAGAILAHLAPTES